ncbi:MAG: virulence RhuM family protein [bacterium]
MKKQLPDKPAGEILLYQTEDGQTRLEVRLEDESVWLTQAAIAELFQTTPQNVTLHLKNIFFEKELIESAACKEYLQVQKEGSRDIQRRRKFYNLEAIIAVGYRVRSHRGMQFRRWATERLREYLVKGFVMDDKRLKAGVHLGTDYFDELLERIRDIRASEKRFYQKIRDIYKLSIDYDPNTDETKEFFKIVQNKLHFAIAGKTAAEIIAERADAARSNMGLTAWKSAKVRKTDVTIAKNYLTEQEISELNRVVTMYLDYAENQARRHHPLYMRDWREKLDAFLDFHDHDILENTGKVSMKVTQALAEYEKFSTRRLAEEADAEAQADDAELKRLQKKIEKKR